MVERPSKKPALIMLVVLILIGAASYVALNFDEQPSKGTQEDFRKRFMGND